MDITVSTMASRTTVMNITGSARPSRSATMDTNQSARIDRNQTASLHLEAVGSARDARCDRAFHDRY
jgi:hypothetical protein